jgi:hypothetical protein
MLTALNYKSVLNFPTGKLAGRSTASAGALEALDVGSGLSLAAGALTAAMISVSGRTGAVTLATGDISGLGSVATHAAGEFAAVASNLSDLANPATARTNLGLGSAALLAAGGASGAATLDGSGKLSASQIPDIAIVSYLGSVASQAAMLALTGQQGDWAIRTDLSTTWVITGADPTQLASWTQLSYPTAPVTSVASRTGAVTLTAADIGNGAALTRVNDTNVTLTLGGTPASALLVSASLTLGWSGQLGLSRGGTNADLSATGGAGQYLKQATVGGAVTVGTIAAGDVPTLNQNTTGSAATLTTPRSIYGNNFDGSAALAQIIASTFGGTGNGFTKFSGPATAEKTFTLPNASATILTDNAAVTVGQGGTGVATLASNGVLYGNAASAVQALAVNSTATNKFLTQSSSAAPAWAALGAGDIPATLNATTFSGDVTLQTKVAKVVNVNTAGATGVLVTRANAQLTGQVASVGSVATFTTPAADGDYLVTAEVRVTTATTHSFTVIFAYTDEGNNARTGTINFSNLAGTISPTIANAGGAVPYMGIPLNIRTKSGSAITIGTTGTFTSVVYNISASIIQIG